MDNTDATHHQDATLPDGLGHSQHQGTDPLLDAALSLDHPSDTSHLTLDHSADAHLAFHHDDPTLAFDSHSAIPPAPHHPHPASMELPKELSSDALGGDPNLKRPKPHDENEQGWETVDRSKKSKKAKKIPAKESSNYPTISFNYNAKLQSKIALDQLRNLILYIFAEGVAPQWVSISHRPQFRKIVAIMVPGLEEAMFKPDVDFATYNDPEEQAKSRVLTSPDDYYPRLLKKDELPTILKDFADMFPHLWPVKTPGSEKFGIMRSPMGTVLTAPGEKSSEEKKQKGVQPAREPKGWKDERTRITEYLTMAEDFQPNGYVLHPACLPADRRKGLPLVDNWVYTKVENFEDGIVPEEEIQQGSITAGREVLALDCEMCVTGPEEYSLARISLINWEGTVILDEFVKPDKPIIDYVTRFSGITEEDLAPVTTTLADIQRKLVEILHPRTILVGHSLDSDLKALRMTHPFIIDTALLYPHARGPPLKNSLKFLTQRFLKREIQKGTNGHCSVEDSKACLDLVKQKCEKGKSWGNHESQGENLFRRLNRVGRAYRANGGPNATGGINVGKTSAMVDWGDPMKGAGAAATFPMGCNSDAEVAANVQRAVAGDPAAEVIPAGGVDFVFARFRELEALQGWWNRNREGGARPPPAPPAAAPQATIPTPATGDLSTDDSNAAEVAAAVVAAAAAAAASASANSGDSNPDPNSHNHQGNGISNGGGAAPHQIPPHITTQPGAPPDFSSTDMNLEMCLRNLATHIRQIYDSLPPCTAFIVFSGSGDPREMSRLQAMQSQFKREYNTPGSQWDKLSVRWTDREDQALKKAVGVARNGIGFIGVK